MRCILYRVRMMLYLFNYVSFTTITVVLYVTWGYCKKNNEPKHNSGWVWCGTRVIEKSNVLINASWNYPQHKMMMWNEKRNNLQRENTSLTSAHKAAGVECANNIKVGRKTNSSFYSVNVTCELSISSFFVILLTLLLEAHAPSNAFLKMVWIFIFATLEHTITARNSSVKLMQIVSNSIMVRDEKES